MDISVNKNNEVVTVVADIAYDSDNKYYFYSMKNINNCIDESEIHLIFIIIWSHNIFFFFKNDLCSQFKSHGTVDCYLQKSRQLYDPSHLERGGVTGISHLPDYSSKFY